MNNWINVGLKLGLSVVIIIIVFISLDFEELAMVLSEINYKFFFIIIPVLPLSVYIRVYRWRYLMNYKQEINISQSFAARVTLVGLALNIFMPAQSGEILKGYFGYKWSGIKERMFVISFYDKIIAIAGVGVLGFFSAIYYTNLWFMIASLAAFLPLLILYALLRFKKLEKYADKILRKIFRNKFDVQLAKKQFNFDYRLLARSIFVSVVGWILIYVILWGCFGLVATDVKTTPNLYYVLMVAPILTLGRLFPFTLNGLGSDEALIVLIFNIVNVSPAMSFAAALIYKIITTIIPGLVGLFIVLISKNKH